MSVKRGEDQINASGVVSTLAGQIGVSGSANGTGTGATFNTPSYLRVDASGNVFVTDPVDSTVRKITSGGVVTTFAGTPGSTGTTDATGTSARFNAPRGITSDAAGNLYVCDTGNHSIRKITSGGVVTTYAGRVGMAGTLDGAGTSAGFDGPRDIAADGAGNLYVIDKNSSTVRKIDAGVNVTTVVGAAYTANLSLGALPAGLFTPLSLAVGAGKLKIFDSNQVLTCPAP